MNFYTDQKKKSNIMNFKRIRLLVYDLIYIFLTLGIIFLIVSLNGVFIANITNSLRMTGYLDPIFGIQVIMVLVSLVWVPLGVLVKHYRD